MVGHGRFVMGRLVMDSNHHILILTACFTEGTGSAGGLDTLGGGVLLMANSVTWQPPGLKLCLASGLFTPPYPRDLGICSVDVHFRPAGKME